MDIGTRATATTPVEEHGWRRMGVVAALVMGGWSAVLQTVAGTVIPPVLVVGVLFVALAVLLARVRRRWVAIVAGVLPLAALAANIPPIAHDLAHPEEALVFTLTAVSVVGALLTSLAGWMVVFDRGGSWPPVAIVAGGAVAVAALVGVVASAGVESVAAAAGDVPVEARAVRFSPSEIRVDATASGLWVDNTDPFAHTFTVDGTDIDLRLPGNSSQRVDVGLAPGTYTVICTVPGHEAMTATMIVEG